MSNSSEKSEFLLLLHKYLHQQASPEEIRFLHRYYDHFTPAEKASLSLTGEEQQKLADRMLHNIRRQIKAEPAINESRVPVIPWRRMAAAAVLFMCCAFAAYLILQPKSTKTASILSSVQPTPNNDLMPGSDKAILTLADGSSIVLDSAHKGKIGSQGNARILKLNGSELAYEHMSAPATDEAVRFNTITTVRGGQYQLRLSDGSKVWLNASSSLRYPVLFQGDRSVELTGEAYFEIAPQIRSNAQGIHEKIPFTVQVNGTRVEVLGTHFNINGYADEPTIKTTLLEGIVNVSSGNKTMRLQPGDESMVDKDGEIKRDVAANAEDAVAWKNGQFQFRSADIQTIMRQVSRWYDVDVDIEKPITEKFYAELPRNTSAAALFAILEKTGAVHFKVEGKKVNVLP